ncbi:MAG: citrate synthase [Planctomycetes bacterium]|nr:citrate synthase [Planctomycetota bacterium]
MTNTTESQHATFQLGDQTLELPVVRGSEGEIAVDISKLRGQSGWITLDPGFGNTGSCKSAISFINGEKGILRHRGYAIDDLAKNSTFLEVAWLLIHGELPSKAELEEFVHEVTTHTMLHEDFGRFFSSLPKSGHPMPVCAAAVGALSTFYQDKDNERHIVRLIAKMPTIAAYSFKHSIGQPFMFPRNDLDYSSNFLRMMFGTPCEEYVVDPVIAEVVDRLLILHADHEQNCSTSTVRLVGSSRASIFASLAAGISALWGPLHGGANQRVIEMLETIQAEEGSAKKFLDRAKDRNDTARLMGFGHRVYKSYDPRAQILKQDCRTILSRLDAGSNRLFEIAMELEEIALSDDYFVSRKLYPNVDFYSGIILKALGIPVNMFTVLFTLGRTPGWIAQWVEMRNDPDTRIGRPRQIYVGATERSYVPLDQR